MNNRYLPSLLLTAVFASSMIGCAQSISGSIPLSAETHIIEGQPDITIGDDYLSIKFNTKDSAVVNYTIDGLEPYSFYEVSADFKTTGNAKAMLAGSLDDINRFSIIEETNEDGIMKRMIRTDANGKCSFGVSFNHDKLKTSGNITVSDFRTASADSSREFSNYSSSDDSIRILLRTDDVKRSGVDDETITKWLDLLSRSRETVNSFAVEKLDHIDICATDPFKHYGLSGDPIYISADTVTKSLQRIAETLDTDSPDISFAYIHEFCHAADGFGREKIADRVFDSEFNAEIECIYCMYHDGLLFDGCQSAIEYYSDCTPLEKGIYSDKGLIYRILQIIDDAGKTPEDLLPALINDKYTPDMSDNEKMELFFRILNEESGINIISNLSDKEKEVISWNFT